MENEIFEPQSYSIEFKGEKGKYTGIMLLNYLLIAVTLSFYKPWASAKSVRYLFSTFFFEGESLKFHGTGKEMFGGFIKSFVLYISILLAILAGNYFFMEEFSLFFVYFILITVSPLWIHSTMRYTLSRTTWHGIRFAYTGERKEFVMDYLQWAFFSIITLGIYGCWAQIKMVRYIIGNIRIGNMEMRFKGREFEYFKIAFIGGLLSVVTLGIYSIWWLKNMNNYFINNTTFYKDGTEIRLKSTLGVKEVSKVGITNLLIGIFTFGFGTPIVIIRHLKMIFNNIEAEGTLDLYNVQPVYNEQEEEFDFLDFKFTTF